MTEYSNNNRGALFKNNKKKTEKHPDYTGSINVNGADMWISAWLQTSKGGMPYMSLSVTKKEKQAEPRSVPGIDRPDYPHEPQGYDGPQTDNAEPDFTDDIPF